MSNSNSTAAQQGHPKGLYLLFVTEMWERFSYYGMRALFTLFMVNALLLDETFAQQIYGSYSGLVYLTPLIGGYVADRYWGNRRSILCGGVLMAIGQLFMFASATFHAEKQLAFYLMIAGLCFLIVGNGFFKPNISTMVGDLYEPADKRKDSAFTIFYMGINTGAFVAPLVCGFLGDTGNPDDFRWGFLCAAIGMLFGILVFELLKNKYIHKPDGTPIGMPPAYYKKNVEVKAEDDVIPVKGNAMKRAVLSLVGFAVLFLLFTVNFSGKEGGLFAGADWIGAFIYATCIVMPVFIITDPSLTKTERSRIGVIYIIAFFVIFFWSAFEQAGASLTIFADRQVDREIFGWTMPASYFQSFNPVFIIALAPIFALVWTKLGKVGREPASPTKQAIGLFLLSMGYLVIAFGVDTLPDGQKASILLLGSMYLIHTMGELCLSPIGLSMVNKLAPARLASLLMGVWFLSTATANKFAGTLGTLYPFKNVDGNEILDPKHLLGIQIDSMFDFFMVFVVMSLGASVILFLLSSKLQKMMKGIE